jgi:hypothetical protein
MLNRRAAHFAVALCRMTVAREELRAALEDREEERASGGQLLEIEIAAKRPRRPGTLDTEDVRIGGKRVHEHTSRGCHANGPHERRRRHVDRVRDGEHVAAPDLCDTIQMLPNSRNGSRRRDRGQPWIAGPEPGVGRAEHAAHRARVVDPVRHAQVDVEDLHFECVSGLRPVDVDGAGEDVRSISNPRASTVRDRFPECLQVREDLRGRNAKLREECRGADRPRRTGLGQGVDANRLPRLHRQDRREVDREPAPDNVLGR